MHVKPTLVLVSHDYSSGVIRSSPKLNIVSLFPYLKMLTRTVYVRLPSVFVGNFEKGHSNHRYENNT